MKIQKNISNKIYDIFKVVYEKDVSFNYNGLKVGICHKEFIDFNCETEQHDIVLDKII